MAICSKCGEDKPCHARGLCQRCYKRQQYLDNRAEKLAYRRRYYQEHKEQILAYAREYNKRHPEKKAVYQRRYRQANPNKNRDYYRANREQRIIASRQWRKDNPSKVREYGRQRRAREVDATIGRVNEQELYALYNYTCIYCGATEDLTLDHVVALAQGGAHSEDNLVVACAHCNCSKRAKPLERWLETQPFALAWVM